VDGGDVTVLFEADHTLVLLSGAVDLSVTDDLEQAGRDAVDAALPLVADVRRVDMIDSVGISFLVRMAASARDHGSTMVLRGPAPRVRELLVLVGADDLFTWQDVEADASSA
jgi:anti-anti-sigma factor